MENLGEKVKDVYPFGHPEISFEKLCAWTRKLTRTLEVGEVGSCPRLVNHFKVGADPEFVFTAGGECIGAAQVGLKAGPAFGADNNGRLVEIRPHPSKSTLEVTASILAAMRWMAIKYPQTRDYEWWSGAFQFHDGLGGHVHFGRKRATRDEELYALDAITELLLKLGTFPAEEMRLRRRGDQFRQVYGMPHDYRLQNHGYEYRTFPSWLDSPWMTYFVLTLSKLAVVWPQAVREIRPAMGRAAIENLLGYFKGSDDDARLCLAVLKTRGIPHFQGGDFRSAWGISGLGYATVRSDQTPTVIPAAIPPSTEDTREMMEHLLKGTRLTARVPKPTWEPTTVPDGYVMLINSVTTTHVKGLGEIIWDLVCAAGMPLKVVQSDGPGMGVGEGLAKHLDRGWQGKVQEILGKDGVYFHHTGEPTIWLGAGLRSDGQEIARARKALTCGVFPIWKVGRVGKNSLEEWKKGVNPLLPKKRKSSTEVLFAEGLSRTMEGYLERLEA